MKHRPEAAPPCATPLTAAELDDVVAHATREWWCQDGAHACTGEQLRYRGRRVCAQCKARIKARAAQRKRELQGAPRG